MLGTLSLLLMNTGCYYADLARGQARLLLGSRPVADVLSDPQTSPQLRANLETVEKARTQARELGLQVDGQYTSFVAWPEDRIITTVVATRPGEVQPADFSFFAIGKLPYKGFFDPAQAQAEAEKLAAQGLDTCVSPVTAYSTLGWLDDPVTEPMLKAPPGRIAEVVVHEFVHATIFIREDAEFNESLATFIGQEASVRFFKDPAQAARQRARVNDARMLAKEIGDYAHQVELLYEEPRPPNTKARAELEARFRKRVARLPFEARNREQAQAAAQALRLNDACLALRGTYGADIPAFETKLHELDGDLPGFIERAKTAAKQEDPREALLGNGADSSARGLRSSDASAESPAHGSALRYRNPTTGKGPRTAAPPVLARKA